MKRVSETTAAILIGAELIGNSNLNWYETLIIAFIYIVISFFANEDED